MSNPDQLPSLPTDITFEICTSSSSSSPPPPPLTTTKSTTTTTGGEDSFNEDNSGGGGTFIKSERVVSGMHFLTDREEDRGDLLLPKSESGDTEPEVRKQVGWIVVKYKKGFHDRLKKAYRSGIPSPLIVSGVPQTPLNFRNIGREGSIMGKGLLEYLIQNDGSVVCKWCGEVLPSRTRWYRHKYKLHVSTQVTQPAPLFKCHSCNAYFKSRKGYIGHLSSRHSDNENDENREEPANKKARKTSDIGKGPDWEQQREKEEKLVADIIDRVKRECEAQGETVTRRGYSRRSTVMNS
ncbi:hypothetical protein WN55_00441 [Dufourea novaeangliae]|uniref:C2H2-type domain-containing protein n=1 Tax=Dufourea novaeangliae TaxID=178035 RepID=A0A154PFQ6_DUFNO|nr:hypothetical protein WN55_00441 [Dufourea novaeangliae]